MGWKLVLREGESLPPPLTSEARSATIKRARAMFAGRYVWDENLPAPDAEPGAITITPQMIDAAASVLLACERVDDASVAGAIRAALKVAGFEPRK